MAGMSEGPRQYPPTMPMYHYGQQPPPPPPKRSIWRSKIFVIPVVIAVVLVAVTAGLVIFSKLRADTPDDTPSNTPSATGGQAAKLPAGRTWLSGGWPGKSYAAKRIDAFGTFRGQPFDLVTTYPAYSTWDEMKGSEWHIGNFDGFKGRLIEGIPLLPDHGDGSLGDVAAGKYDDVFKTIGQQLLKHNRGDSYVRIGLEANGTWFPWGATADRADHYKAAWRHVQALLKATVPDLTFVFDITCGKPLEGGKNRTDSLNLLYPGDDVVDIVGCDHYDSYTVRAQNETGWAQAMHPKTAAGLGDLADFARAKGKKMAIPEWGLTSAANSGGGDNPFFIYKMFEFFTQNKDILAFEAYFNEPGDTVGSAIWDPNQNPNASKEYLKLFNTPLVKVDQTG
jgi:hypothetical protein